MLAHSKVPSGHREFRRHSLSPVHLLAVERLYLGFVFQRSHSFLNNRSKKGPKPTPFRFRSLRPNHRVAAHAAAWCFDRPAGLLLVSYKAPVGGGAAGGGGATFFVASGRQRPRSEKQPHTQRAQRMTASASQSDQASIARR